MLRQAATKLAAKPIRWVPADVHHLPFADESFDCAICANSFHYFHSPVDALCEIRRVLRPGGQFVLVDWCDDYLSCKLCSWWLRLTEPAFHQTYTLASCRSLLQRSGFAVRHADRFRENWLWGLMHFDCRRQGLGGGLDNSLSCLSSSFHWSWSSRKRFSKSSAGASTGVARAGPNART
jgi:ubiquinone/menaquinone biosynthesis C-methylase UbiE